MKSSVDCRNGAGEAKETIYVRMAVPFQRLKI